MGGSGSWRRLRRHRPVRRQRESSACRLRSGRRRSTSCTRQPRRRRRTKTRIRRAATRRYISSSSPTRTPYCWALRVGPPPRRGVEKIFTLKLLLNIGGDVFVRISGVGDSRQLIVVLSAGSRCQGPKPTPPKPTSDFRYGMLPLSLQRPLPEPLSPAARRRGHRACAVPRQHR